MSLTVSEGLRSDVSIPERRLLADRERFVAFAFAAAELLLEVAPDGRVAFAAGAFRSRLGIDPAELMGRPVATLIAAEDGAVLAAFLANLAARGRMPATFVRLANGARTACFVSGLARHAADGAKLFCLSLGPVPAAVRPAPAELRSKEALLREAEARLRQVRRDPGAQAPMLDLVELDLLGGDVSEAALCGALLEGAGPGTVVGALGDGRYGLLHTPDADGVLPDMTRVLEAMGHAVGEARVRRGGTLSLGEGLGTVQAVRALRQALSTFSRGGTEAMAAAGFGGGLAGFVETAEARATALRRAIEERRFGLSYQPIVSLRDRSVHHYEALLRPRPAAGLPQAATGDFVSMVEMVGLSERLDLAVLERAAAAARDSGQSVAFNLSALSVQNPEFRPLLMRALDRVVGARGPRLLVEITETAEIEDEEAAAATVAALRARGIRVCIDDFGAGAAGFRVLRGLCVDFMKIDGSYVRHAAEDERDRAFVSAMIDLALGVKAEVIAEQIESEVVAAQMRALGAGYGQGWLFGRPVPALPVRGCA